jgi:hypothetical protein
VCPVSIREIFDAEQDSRSATTSIVIRTASRRRRSSAPSRRRRMVGLRRSVTITFPPDIQPTARHVDHRIAPSVPVRSDSFKRPSMHDTPAVRKLHRATCIDHAVNAGCLYGAGHSPSIVE